MNGFTADQSRGSRQLHGKSYDALAQRSCAAFLIKICDLRCAIWIELYVQRLKNCKMICNPWPFLKTAITGRERGRPQNLRAMGLAPPILILPKRGDLQILRLALNLQKIVVSCVAMLDHWIGQGRGTIFYRLLCMMMMPVSTPVTVRERRKSMFQWK